MDDWHEEKGQNNKRVWRDSEGAVLSFAMLEQREGLPEPSDETGVQQWFRSVAEQKGAGLVEARVLNGITSAIYKRLELRAYIFTGMLFIPHQEACLIWTVVDGEHGTTGIREAVVTQELINAGVLRRGDYERFWAQDPYDSNYRGVDRSVLRFISDDECYDMRFPHHPLSKIRRTLAMLPASMQIVSVPLP